MNFSEVLNDYMKMLNITGKELSLKSGIPAPTISGYKNGNKEPKYNSDTLEKLINAVYEISKEKKIKIKKDEIKDNLEKYLIKNNIDFDIFRTNLNILIETLNINVSDLSKYIGFDSSYISKIRSGLRKPFNISDFAEGITKYVINNYYDDKTTIDNLISATSLDELSLKNNLYTWLTNNKLISKSDYKIDNFFKKLDDFDLNNYIKAIKFDKLIVPTLPKILFKTKKYYGIDGYKDSQLEVLKQIAFSKNPGDIFWYSDMPMEKISKDLKFTKRYMMYIAFVLKKGFTLNIIHDVNRPFNELMLGLEGWIPLYMTGQIKPYYFKSAPMSIYEHIECVGDASILHGEGVKGHIESSKFLVSNKIDDINFYKDNFKLLLKKASPLMNIYNETNKNDFTKRKKEFNEDRRNILLSLPVYVVSDDLINKLLDYNNISDTDKKIIKKYIDDKKKEINNILNNNRILDEITIYNEKEFSDYKVTLDLSEIFYNKEIVYNYDTYKQHIENLKEYKKDNKNYNYIINKNNIFNNINIHIINNKEVTISKINNPVTHFVIHHPKLIHAIENFEVPIKEE